MEDNDAGMEQTAPVWAVFGDLMAGLLGAFVLLLVGVLVVQLQLATHLQDEVKKRQVEEQRRITLEKALAIPLAAGRITLTNIPPFARMASTSFGNRTSGMTTTPFSHLRLSTKSTHVAW